jgi:formate dehydrogenase gamma subunit
MARKADTEQTFTRFSLSQRVEHTLLVVSFTMLCLTGLPQRFFDAAWAQWLISLLGGLDSVRFVHHLFGIMLVFQGIYHVLVALYELLFARSKPTQMFPRPRDVKEAFQQIAHLAGMRAEKPRFGRYDFRHKVEYWSVAWGTLLMGATGLILLFPVVATGFLPGVVVTASRVAHSYEALLAFLAIVLWHFYHSHFAAEAFPMDTSIFTGRISAEKMREEHPLEYEQLMLERRQGTGTDG